MPVASTLRGVGGGRAGVGSSAQAAPPAARPALPARAAGVAGTSYKWPAPAPVPPRLAGLAPSRLARPAVRHRARAPLPPAAVPPPLPAEGGDAAAAASIPAPPLIASGGLARRLWVVGACFVAFMLCNMDRVNMSIAILPMASQYGWDTQTIGLVQSSFFWGYLLTQVLGGVWADRYGGARVLGAGVLWWSAATALTPLAAAAGLPALLAARAAMGVGEGVAMPAMNTLLSRWVPVQERSRALALVYSGMYAGSVAGLGASPHIIHAAGWPSVFYIFGALGIVWYVGWAARAAPSPAEDPRCSEEERRYIAASAVAARPASSIPWKTILSKPAVWALIVAHFCHNWGTFILLTWMPTYYNQALGLDIVRSGALSVLPWICMALAANVGGWIADTAISRGASVTTVRKVAQTVGFLGPAFFLTRLGDASTATAAVLCMAGAQATDALGSNSGLYSNHADIAPRYAGVLLGLSNTAGVLAGVLGTAATGYILKAGGWSDVWGVAIGLYLVGSLVWLLFSTGEKILD